MLRGNTILYPSLVDWFLNAAEAVRADKFAQPLSVPQRYESGLRTASQLHYAPFVKASPFAETVTADRWFQPLGMPIPPRRPPEFPTLSYTFVVGPAETITVDKWFRPLEQPRLAPRLHTSGILVQSSPFAEAVTADKWAQSLSLPIPARRVPEFPALSYEFVVGPPEVVTLDKWHRPFEQPRLPPRQHTGGILVKAASFAELVTADRWFQPLSLPIPARRLREFPVLSYALLSLSLPPSPPPPPPPPFQPASSTVRSWRQLVLDADPDRQGERPVVYEFSNGRKFRDKPDPYSK